MTEDLLETIQSLRFDIDRLKNEVARMRPVVNAAVKWRRIGYERKDEFSYRIGPLLDAIDVYDIGTKRPCEEL